MAPASSKVKSNTLRLLTPAHFSPQSFFAQFLLEKKINLGQKKKEKRKKIFPRPRLDSNSLTPKQHNTGPPRAMPPHARVPACLPLPRSHTHRSAVRLSQTTFHSDDVITRGVDLFDTKRYTDAPYYYYWEVAEFLGSEVDSSFPIFLYTCFFVRVLCMPLLLFGFFFLVIFAKTAKLWVGHRVGHRVGHGPGHGLAQVL